MDVLAHAAGVDPVVKSTNYLLIFHVISLAMVEIRSFLLGTKGTV